MTIFNKLGQTIVNFFGEHTELDGLAESRKFSSDYLDPDYLADLLPYRVFDQEHKIYENKSSFGFVLEVIPLLGAGETTQNEISALIREIGEEKASIQCLAWADHRIDRFLELWSKPRRSRGDIFDEIIRKKENFLKQESLSGEVPPRIFRFLFSYSEPKRPEQSLPLILDRLLEKKEKPWKHSIA